MKIGFCGTMSVGKSTLVRSLCHNYPNFFDDYFIATERSKYLNSLGIPLNTDSTIRGQFVFMAERASELLQRNLLTDRTIWDVCAFTLNSKTISEENKHKLITAATCLMPHYDIVFYVSPEGVAIEDNGIRETNAEYRTKIDETIKHLLFMYPPKQLIEISGTNKERMDKIMDVLQNS
jgi:hypothetical protein